MALNILITNGCDSRGLKLSSLNEDEQDTARGMSFFYGYSKMHFDGDDYFSVVIDDFSFNYSTITKLVVELLKRKLLERYAEPDETHAEPYFDYISCCDIFGWRTKSNENCYKLAMKIVKEYLKEESTVEETTTAVWRKSRKTQRNRLRIPARQWMT